MSNNIFQMQLATNGFQSVSG